MEHLIIGTAGHIDHGKTAMIRALTGRDTDTLKEEKERGISIDLGFTYFDLPDGRRAGVIDVPGHEKFLPNMLAGVCGMDMVLLVIALDEGIMPQTREHMDILEKLHVSGGIIVLTKTDCVEEEWADMAEEEIKNGLKGTIFESWPCYRISAVLGTGISELKAEIVKEASRVKRTRNTAGCFRMPVDRVISMKGLGTVIAGTVMEGIIRQDETVMLYPSEKTARIRSIQMHGIPAEKACAGQRAALLLAGVKTEEVKRGCVAADPESLKKSSYLDVKLEMVKNTSRTIKNRTRVHLHIGTSQLLCKILLLDTQELCQGQSGYAQLILEKEIAVKKKDRFIIRFFSPLETIGGGIVLEECPRKHRRFDEHILSELRNKEEDKTEDILLSLIEKNGSRPCSINTLVQQSGIHKESLEELTEELISQYDCVVFCGKKDRFCWGLKSSDRECRKLENCLSTFHEQWPFKLGMEKNILKNLYWKDWDANCFNAWMNDLEMKKIIKRNGTQISLFVFSPVENQMSKEILNTLTQAFSNTKFDLVDIKKLCPDHMDEIMYQDIIRFLEEKNKIVRISDEYFTTPQLAAEMKNRVKEYFKTNPILTYSSLRDLLRNTRRSARPIMAYLDEQKITKECGKEAERVEYEG